VVISQQREAIMVKGSMSLTLPLRDPVRAFPKTIVLVAFGAKEFESPRVPTYWAL
jgi:hypothetical protein